MFVESSIVIKRSFKIEQFRYSIPFGTLQRIGQTDLFHRHGKENRKQTKIQETKYYELKYFFESTTVLYVNEA